MAVAVVVVVAAAVVASVHNAESCRHVAAVAVVVLVASVHVQKSCSHVAASSGYNHITETLHPGRDPTTASSIQ